ncbi:hypothetical protein NQ317_014154 [Molorchus minor]|uniref:Uncharacterized protein n=1 Tax=Molorchus minor TaxID=1323400 RepID=A0ABQ9J2X0_9CUCU|nr:hypothetical protein NQ317_014154 [Molorchus minor]
MDKGVIHIHFNGPSCFKSKIKVVNTHDADVRPMNGQEKVRMWSRSPILPLTEIISTYLPKRSIDNKY